jgi:hypothetical protein
MITWLWITGVPFALFAAGIAGLSRYARRESVTLSWIIAAWRMRCRRAMSTEEARRL